MAAPLRAERDEIKFRYDRACTMIEEIIADDLSVRREDMQQRIVDMKKLLWHDIYGPYDKECAELLKLINKFEKR